MTPPALFTDMVRTAESLLHRQAAELIRRQEWLAATVVEEASQEEPRPAHNSSAADKYGVDLDI